MIVEVDSLEKLREYAFAEADRYAGPRLLLLLDGPMGAGKTQYTKFFVEGLGRGDQPSNNNEVTSPSFAIQNHYPTSKGEVTHVDLYRLESVDDLESTGFWDLFLEKQGIVIVEWSDRLRDWDVYSNLPRTWPVLKLRFGFGPGAEAREILVNRA